MSCSIISNVTAFAHFTNHDFTSLLPHLKAQGYDCHMYLQKVSLKVPPQGIAYIAEGISKRYFLPRSLLKVSLNCP